MGNSGILLIDLGRRMVLDISCFIREVTDDLSCLLKDRHMGTEMTQQAWSSRQWESGGPGTPCGVPSPGR